MRFITVAIALIVAMLSVMVMAIPGGARSRALANEGGCSGFGGGWGGFGGGCCFNPCWGGCGCDGFGWGGFGGGWGGRGWW